LVRTAEALDRLMKSAGEPSSAYDLRYELPTEKARAALAKLGEAAVPGMRLIEITLAVTARVNDRGPTGDHEFLTVQIAKAAHRLASGTHRTTWDIPIRSKYPPSAGRMLRILGGRIWEIAAVAAAPSAVNEVIRLAKPEADKAAAVEERRKNSRAVYVGEIERARSLGMGPASFERYRVQLKRQYGIK